MPVIAGGAYGFEHLNVAAQRRDPNSFLNWLERVLPHAQGSARDRLGRLRGAAHLANPAVLVLRYDWRNNAVLFLHNLAGRAVRSAGSRRRTSHGRAACWSTCWPRTTATADDDGRHCVLLEPYGYRWFRVGGLDYLLKRSEV